MWHYSGSVIDKIEQFPPNAHAFIYRIINIDSGKWYVGRKNLYSKRNKPLTKNEIKEQDALKKPGKKKTKKLVITESNWLQYFSSEETLKEDAKSLGPSAFKREILHITFSEKSTTYQELRYQILHGVLESDNCYNGQILGKFWRKDI